EDGIRDLIVTGVQTCALPIFTIQGYKESRLVADPIRLLDCVLPANGGKAYILASPERANKLRKPPVYILGFGERSNPSYGPRAEIGRASCRERVEISGAGLRV